MHLWTGPLLVHLMACHQFGDKPQVWWQAIQLPELMTTYCWLDKYRQVSNIRRTLVVLLNCWSLRCSWSIACRRCSNYIFILHLTFGFNILHKDNCKLRRETFKFWDLVRLILEILRHVLIINPHVIDVILCSMIKLSMSLFFNRMRLDPQLATWPASGLVRWYYHNWMIYNVNRNCLTHWGWG